MVHGPAWAHADRRQAPTKAESDAPKPARSVLRSVTGLEPAHAEGRRRMLCGGVAGRMDQVGRFVLLPLK